jgi:hypothetical protein
MDNKWFKEDREAARKDKSVDLNAEIEKSRTALKNSTLFQRRLEQILKDMLEESLRNDEDFSKPNWERECVANVSRRKTLKEIMKIIQI